MRILILGGSGFLGKPLVRELAAHGHAVTVLCREDEQDVPAGVRVIVGDIRNKASIRAAFPADIVYHFAASQREGDPQLWPINVTGTQHVAALSKECGARQIIFMSFAGVLGPTRIPLAEHAVHRPATRYEKSKVAAENIIRNSGIPYTIIRSPLILGPNDFNASLLEALEKKHALPAGKNALHVAHRDDVIRLLVRVLDAPDAKNHVFHVGTRDLMTFAEVQDTIRKELRLSPTPSAQHPAVARLRAHGRWLSHAARTGRPPSRHLSSHDLTLLSTPAALSLKKAQQQLHFEPAHTTPSAIHVMCQELRSSSPSPSRQRPTLSPSGYQFTPPPRVKISLPAVRPRVRAIHRRITSVRLPSRKRAQHHTPLVAAHRTPTVTRPAYSFASATPPSRAVHEGPARSKKPLVQLPIPRHSLVSHRPVPSHAPRPAYQYQPPDAEPLRALFNRKNKPARIADAPFSYQFQQEKRRRIFAS